MSPRPAQSEAFRRIEDLYHAAVELPSSERPSFLEIACCGDDALFREIKSLLEAHDQAAGFLERPAIQTAAERYRKAVSELRLAAELDPPSPHIAMVLGSVLYSDRQYDQAIEAEHKVLEMNPNSGIAYIHIALCNLVRRRFAEATVALDRAGDLMPGLPVALRAYIDAQTGNRQAALNALGKVAAATNSGLGTALDLPAIYVGLGDKRRRL